MKIVEEVYSEDCFDGNFIKEYTLDEKVSDDWIKFLKNFGKITILDGAKQSFYSLDKKYFFTIKGLVGEDRIKVIFRRNNMDITVDFLHVLLERFSLDEKNIMDVKEIENEILNKMKHID